MCPIMLESTTMLCGYFLPNSSPNLSNLYSSMEPNNGSPTAIHVKSTKTAPKALSPPPPPHTTPHRTSLEGLCIHSLLPQLLHPNSGSQSGTRHLPHLHPGNLQNVKLPGLPMLPNLPPPSWLGQS